jgi:hypothetical protein
VGSSGPLQALKTIRISASGTRLVLFIGPLSGDRFASPRR